MIAAKISVYSIAGLSRGAVMVILLGLSGAASSPALAWDWNPASWNAVSGSGKVRTEVREVSGFTAIALSLNGPVELRQSGTEGLIIEADDNILPLIDTVVENKTLKIRHKPRGASFSTRNLKIVVNFKNLDQIEVAGGGDIHADALRTTDLKAGVSGSGDIRIQALVADALKVSLAGSGDFEAAGRVASMRVSIAGSGGIKAGKLDAGAVDINIAGSGDASVWARDTLKVRIAGSGDVAYYGDAKVQQKVVGSGSVTRLGAAP